MDPNMIYIGMGAAACVGVLILVSFKIGKMEGFRPGYDAGYNAARDVYQRRLWMKDQAKGQRLALNLEGIGQQAGPPAGQDPHPTST